MSAKDLYVKLGETADKLRVWAQIRIDPSDERESQFTDHSTGPTPERVSVMFTVLSSPQHPKRALDRYWVSTGQTPSEDRVLVEVSKAPFADRLDAIWQEWHLNDMTAACDHMTEEMLNPLDAVLDEYIASNPQRARYGRQSALQSYRIDRVKCPVTDYTYGHAWLVRKVPESVLEELRDMQRYAR